MFKFTESISIDASRAKTWAMLTDIEEWWPPSNPEHIGIKINSSEKPLGVGSKIVFDEKVAGIKAHAEGSITIWAPESEAVWEGMAVYRYYGIPLRVSEGVSWQVEGNGESSTLSATVWAKFPPNVFGTFLEWYATKFLNVVDRDREHARCELEYLKRTIEESD